MMYGFDGSNMFWGGGLLMMLFGIGVVVLILWGLKSVWADERMPQPLRATRSALEVAQARYARGEISQDEYLEIVETLQSADDRFQYPKRKRSEF